MDIKKLTETFFTALDRGEWDKFREHTTDDFVLSGPTPEPFKREEAIGMQGLLRIAFPDWKYNLIDIEIKDHTAHAKYQISGTNSGALDLTSVGMGVIPATGKKVKLPVEHANITIKDDKVAKMQVEENPDGGLSGLLKQLGVEIPTQMQAS